MPKQFPRNIQWSFQPLGSFISFDAGTLQARIYKDTGHIEIAGPDLNGKPFANVIQFAPPAVQTDQATLSIGPVMSSKTLATGLELKQKLGNSLITSQLSFPHEGVMRYEVVDWGGITPVATAIAAPSNSQEHFYGFGEKFNRFNQAGKNIHILTFDDPGVKNDHSYKVSPWFVSTRGYGLHLDSSAESLFDMRAGKPDHYAITHLFPSLRFNIVYGPKLTDILIRYTGYTGRPSLPPPWAFGTWISSDIWSSGGEVRYAVTQFRDRGLPASAFVFDSPWETAYNDFNFNMTQFAKDATIDGMHFDGFASLGEMMQFFQTHGLKVICWIAPFVNTVSNDEKVPGQILDNTFYNEVVKQNPFVRASKDGPPLVVPWWKGHGSPIDFTSPSARQWCTDRLKNLVDQSHVTTLSGATEPAIGGFKTDDGESGNGPNTYIPATAHYADGRTGVLMRNGYCFEYHKTVWSVLGNEGLLFSRSGFIGSHGFSGSWAGDNEPNFGDNGLPSVIVAGQSAAMSGYAIWGHDIGGYQNTNFSVSPPNLFMRWAQFGCFSPLMQMHRQVEAKKKLQYPWGYDDAALKNYQFFAQLHTRLFPYLYTYAKEASATGLPIIRPLVLMNQSDTNTFGINHTYHFGNEFFVAPMITPNSDTRQVYLPEGNWIDFWTHARHAGEQTITWTNKDQAQFPLFVRDGAIIPMLLSQVQTLCDANYVNNPAVKTPDSGLLLLIYPAGDSHFAIYDGTNIQCKVGSGQTVITLTSDIRAVMLQILGDAPSTVLRDGIPLKKFATAGEFDTADTGWRADTITRLIHIKFQHGGGNATIQF